MIDRAFVQDQFTDAEEYRAYVLDYLRARELPEDLKLYINSLEG